ncbi:MAG TPA: hypothetical protein DCW90_10330 [Lachnospiraceae bacterium]|nr:hypothetical protein [Lachnospiraceae bacterium]
MNALIRLFDLDPESGHYNDYVYTQWELPLGSPTPRVGEYIYTSPNGCEIARVDNVTYSYNSNHVIMVDCNVTLLNSDN